MKKIISLLLIVAIGMTGCSIKRDTMEDIDIYTTSYPIEYIVKRLYGDHSTVHSIYPDGINTSEYKLTNKQIKDYSESDLYIFNGLNENEKNYVTSMRKNNKNLKIIDTTLAMEYTNGIEELWLNPSNFLMMAQNVKKGLKEYISNYYLNNDINTNYEELKIEASNLDAKIKQTSKNADNKIVVVSSNVFKYLEKYDLTVYSLENGVSDKTKQEVINLIKKGTVKHIFIKENEDIKGVTKELVNTYGIETLSLHTLTNITESQRSGNLNYFDLMNENIETLKTELYN